MRSCESHVKIERPAVIGITSFIYEGESIVTDDIGKISRCVYSLASPVGIGIYISPASSTGCEPMGITFLNLTGGSKMPFSALGADIAVLCKDLGISLQPLKILD